MRNTKAEADYIQMCEEPLEMFPLRTGWEEEGFKSPIGNFSVRNLVVLSLFAAITGGLYKMWFSNGIDFKNDLDQLVLMMLPLLVGLLLARMSPPIGTGDSQLLNMLLLILKPKKKINLEKKIVGGEPVKKVIKARGSKVLGLPITWQSDYDVVSVGKKTSSSRKSGKKGKVEAAAVEIEEENIIRLSFSKQKKPATDLGNYY